MFTGIIETIGRIKSIKTEGSNREFEIESTIASELKIDQSVAHNGVCLTVTSVNNDRHTVVAIDETLQKSSLGLLQPGSKVNLERCMLNNGRFDGHIVQGHVDQTGQIKSVQEEEGSWLYTIEYDASLGNVTVEKGSITINGISLTCFESKVNSFKVAIIPYTYEHTNLHELGTGDAVNLEFDIIGKYVQRLLDKN
ncbi:riboflavin synthase [Fulvivirga sp. M361]|uniref:riboflavin synthase n=1 Tax=Fulvivirga sp. M361 TaxID=2594266 RepID=UPI001179DD4E|nr:riboflavin synthase [Fulvivirga sp. M361]TRX52394.1 riboflavin synthase [Fulvivirga sp. M361]